MKVSLVWCKPDGSAKDVPITRSPRVIGRQDDADLRVADPGVSRRHCEIIIDEEDDAVLVRDLGSSNGTYVNGNRIKEVELGPGDLLAVGHSVFVVRLDGFPKDVDAADARLRGLVHDRPDSASHAAGSRSKTTIVPPAKGKPAPKSPDDSDADFDFDLDDDEDLKRQPKL